MLVSGRGGAPCACFGARGRVGRGSLARVSLLAAAFAVLPALDRREPSTEGWLAIGLAAALLGIAALAVAVLALARELGALRAEIDPRGALEIPEEGPELGGRSELMEVEPGRLGLAVFTSEGCGMCRALEPAIEALGRDPLVRLRTFDEVRDAHAWAAAGIPGSPFAVARRRGRHGAREGNLQHGRAARVRPRHRGAEARMNESRRGFLAKVSGALMAVTGARTVGSLVAPGEAEAYHFCGHIYTTDSCPHPTGLPRIDSRGRPLRAKDGHRVDDLGRLVDLEGRPDRRGRRAPDGRRGRPAARRLAHAGLQGGRRAVRHHAPTSTAPGTAAAAGTCASSSTAARASRRRINGDRSLVGYCYKGRRVFCVMYFQTKVPC